jgi:hypothetical protein
MAERRMFSKKIIDSARFLKMPLETQTLYFHLALRADDDGIVEAFSVLRLVGAAEDSLRILVAKGFITILNEDLVTHVTDWLEHNQIRPDRKVDSIYFDLLVKVLPHTKTIEKRERADRKDGQPMDVPRTDNGPHRLGKESVEKNKSTSTGADAPTQRKKSFSKTTPIESLQLTQEFYDLATNEGFGNHEITLEFEKFKNWNVAKGKTSTNWLTTWGMWVAKTQRPQRSAAAPTSASNWLDDETWAYGQKQLGVSR